MVITRRAAARRREQGPRAAGGGSPGDADPDAAGAEVSGAGAARSPRGGAGLAVAVPQPGLRDGSSRRSSLGRLALGVKGGVFYFA